LWLSLRNDFTQRPANAGYSHFMSDHPKTDEAIARIERKHTHTRARNVTTNYKAAFIELGVEMADMEKAFKPKPYDKRLPRMRAKELLKP
jgi:hypothetical protein